MKTDIKTSLNRAVDQLPHPSFTDIADAPVRKMETMDRFTRQEEPDSRRRQRLFCRIAVPVFLCLFLILPGARYVGRNLVADSVIDLDVNPSIEITANRMDRVLRVEGLNEDARKLLEGQDYRNRDVREAVAELVIRLDEQHYISREKSAVLLSVGNRDMEKAKRMKQELTDSIQQALEGTGVKPVVIRQNRPENRELQKKAGLYHISPGKMQLVEAVKAAAPELDEKDLAAASIEELYTLLELYKSGTPEWMELDLSPAAGVSGTPESGGNARDAAGKNGINGYFGGRDDDGDDDRDDDEDDDRDDEDDDDRDDDRDDDKDDDRDGDKDDDRDDDKDDDRDGDKDDDRDDDKDDRDDDKDDDRDGDKDDDRDGDKDDDRDGDKDDDQDDDKDDDRDDDKDDDRRTLRVNGQDTTRNAGNNNARNDGDTPQGVDDRDLNKNGGSDHGGPGDDGDSDSDDSDDDSDSDSNDSDDDSDSDSDDSDDDGDSDSDDSDDD